MNDRRVILPEYAEQGAFSEYRKMAATRISDEVFPPGTVYSTPEGLHAEDEETRCAVDVQGGVYPIRESVFHASYEPAERAAHDGEGLREEDAAWVRRLRESSLYQCGRWLGGENICLLPPGHEEHSVEGRFADGSVNDAAVLTAALAATPKDRQPPQEFGGAALDAERLAEQVFALNGYARHRPWCPENKGPADCTCGLYALLDSIRCTCGHKVSVHTDRDVSDVVGWPCSECKSARCRRFALTSQPAVQEPQEASGHE